MPQLKGKYGQSIKAEEQAMDKVGCTQAPFQRSNNNYALWLINGLPLDPISKNNCAQEHEEQLWPLNIFFLCLFVLSWQVYKKKTETAKKEYLKQLAAYRASLVSQVRKWLWVIDTHTHFIIATFEKGHFEMFLFGSLEMFLRLLSHTWMEILWRKRYKNISRCRSLQEIQYYLINVATFEAYNLNGNITSKTKGNTERYI